MFDIIDFPMEAPCAANAWAAVLLEAVDLAYAAELIEGMHQFHALPVEDFLEPNGAGQVHWEQEALEALQMEQAPAEVQETVAPAPLNRAGGENPPAPDGLAGHAQRPAEMPGRQPLQMDAPGHACNDSQPVQAEGRSGWLTDSRYAPT